LVRRYEGVRGLARFTPRSFGAVTDLNGGRLLQDRLSYRSKKEVSSLLFAQRVGKELCHFAFAKLACKATSVAVAGNFVVLDSLSSRDQCEIGCQFVLVFTFIDSFLTFFD